MTPQEKAEDLWLQYYELYGNIGKVIWGGNSWLIEFEVETMSLEDIKEWASIIGSVHDNPSLIKQ